MIDKAIILEKLINHHEQLVIELNKTLLDLAEESNLTVDETIDLEDSSYQDYSSDMKLHYDALLSNSLKDLEKLKSFVEASTHEVVPGALVVTDQLLFFIGVATPKLHIKDYQTLIGISIDSEMFMLLKSKQAGDEFEYDQKKLFIRSII